MIGGGMKRTFVGFIGVLVESFSTGGIIMIKKSMRNCIFLVFFFSESSYGQDLSDFIRECNNACNTGEYTFDHQRESCYRDCQSNVDSAIKSGTYNNRSSQKYFFVELGSTLYRGTTLRVDCRNEEVYIEN
jgi:hypothetical protein